MRFVFILNMVIGLSLFASDSFGETAPKKPHHKSHKKPHKIATHKETSKKKFRRVELNFSLAEVKKTDEVVEPVSPEYEEASRIHSRKPASIETGIMTPEEAGESSF